MKQNAPDQATRQDYNATLERLDEAVAARVKGRSVEQSREPEPRSAANPLPRGLWGILRNRLAARRH